jgi:phage baseplate assembly protein W
MQEILGQDMGFDGDLTVLPAGDVETCAGLDCYLQDLRLRLATEKGELWCHPEYGVRLRRFVKAPATMLNRMDLETEIIEALEADPRTVPGSAQVTIMQWDRAGIRIRATCYAIGVSNPLNLVIGYGADEITLERLFA